MLQQYYRDLEVLKESLDLEEESSEEEVGIGGGRGERGSIKLGSYKKGLGGVYSSQNYPKDNNQI